MTTGRPRAAYVSASLRQIPDVPPMMTTVPSAFLCDFVEPTSLTLPTIEPPYSVSQQIVADGPRRW
jgi:hypothetical protein